MESSVMVIPKHRSQIVPREEDATTLFPPDKHPSPFSRIPFSWEHLPGIPKKPSPNLTNVSSKLQLNHLLPLPPAASTPSSSIKPRKKTSTSNGKLLNVPKYKEDPFIAALVQCSKDADQDTRGKFWAAAKVTRNIGGNISCKGSSAIGVSESIMYLPRSGKKIHWL